MFIVYWLVLCSSSHYVTPIDLNYLYFLAVFKLFYKEEIAEKCTGRQKDNLGSNRWTDNQGHQINCPFSSINIFAKQFKLPLIGLYDTGQTQNFIHWTIIADWDLDLDLSQLEHGLYYVFWEWYSCLIQFNWWPFWNLLGKLYTQSVFQCCHFKARK